MVTDGQLEELLEAAENATAGKRTLKLTGAGYGVVDPTVLVQTQETSCYPTIETPILYGASVSEFDNPTVDGDPDVVLASLCDPETIISLVEEVFRFRSLL